MKRKILNAISTMVLALVMFVLPVFSTIDSSFRTKSQNEYEAQTRTVSASNSAIDFESIFNEYEDANLTQEGSLTTFEGNQTLKLDELDLEDEELDEESLEKLQGEEVKIRYKYTFDYVTDKVTLTAVMIETTSEGEVNEAIIDTIEGKAFVNEAGEIDAELDLDGETILLSELRELGVVDNCGLFKKALKKIAKAVKKATSTAIGVVGAVATVVVPAAIGVACAVTGVGLVATVALGAVAGATIAAATTAASTAEQDGKVDWEIVGVCAGVGGVVGAVVSGAAYGITKAVQAANAAKNVESASKAAEGVGNPVKVEGLGSTGRTIPNNLNEQMAMHQVQSNPLSGATRVPVELNDARWPASDGWVKMQSIVEHSDGTKTTIHYVYNTVKQLFDDFKFLF